MDKTYSRNYLKKNALGQSDQFLAMQEKLSSVAKINRPVLIIGERGTGKELASQRLHFLSKRWKNAFITLNCSALNPSLLESELFGHEAGAYTGASGQRKGRFEMAHEGTLFLDEIGNMPMVVQEKILRVIEYNSFERVGGTKPVYVDVRIVAATNADLPALAKKGKFKQDLLDRLSFEVITLPPLRDRKEDILILAHHFAAQMAVELGLENIPAFSHEVQKQMISHSWLGNIRELKNVIERAVYKNKADTITKIILDPFRQCFSPCSYPDIQKPMYSNQKPEHNINLNKPLALAIDEISISYIKNALAETNYHQKKAAQLLDITYHQFRGLFRKYQNHLSVSSKKDE